MSADFDAADLDLIRRVAETGTLSAAARALGVDQTTAARRLARIERRLGAALFDRPGRRCVPTPLLAAVLPDLAAMTAAAARAGAALVRRRAELAGTVRLSAVGLVQTQILAPAAGDFLAAHPGIRLEFDVSGANLRFAERETDIAVRLGRGPDDTAVITRLGGLRFALYAPRAAAASDPSPRPLVAYTADLAATPEMRLLAGLRPGRPVLARAGQLDVLVALALSLRAEVMLPVLLGDADPRLVRAEADGLVAERDVFRLVHPERRRDPAVAAALAWVDATARAALAA